MGASQSLPELVTAAQANATTAQDQVLDILKRIDGQSAGVGSDEALSEEYRAATVALELIAVDIFTVFEARMQHHFKRGPFSRKLKALLEAEAQVDLAMRLHETYLAINVLKHGKGASYRELAGTRKSRIVLRPAEDYVPDEAHPPIGLVDVSVAGFFDDLTATILEAYQFLENR